MDEPNVDPPAVDEPPESFAELGRRRGETERPAVEWAIDELASVVTAQDVDLEPLLEYARSSRQSLPARHRRAYEAMADALDVDRAVYDVYVFAYSDLCEDLADGIGRSEKHPTGSSAGMGCTNVLVASDTARGTKPGERETGPLVLKNRDIAGRGLRPKSVVEQPPVDGYRGFLTVDTCGTSFVFKGVNDRGLVAANTHIESERNDVDPADQRRNGTVIRELLEECTTVEAARKRLDSYPTRLLGGQTLFLADATDAVLLEIDPVTEEIAVADGPVEARTNHFVYLRSTQTASSTTRRERALAILEDEARAAPGGIDASDGHVAGPDRLARDGLWALARDHDHGPGDDSICRHPGPETDEPHAFGQLTTASAALLEGGSPAIEFVLGNPCERDPTRCVFGDDHSRPLRTGERWLEGRR